MTMRYHDLEGALFRSHSDIPGAPVDELWSTLDQRWIRYVGDRVKPAWYGDRISEAELLEAAQERPTEKQIMSNLHPDQAQIDRALRARMEASADDLLDLSESVRKEQRWHGLGINKRLLRRAEERAAKEHTTVDKLAIEGIRLVLQRKDAQYDYISRLVGDGLTLRLKQKAK
jgi:GNAT superfamily N-acetyltransferase